MSAFAHDHKQTKIVRLDEALLNEDMADRLSRTAQNSGHSRLGLLTAITETIYVGPMNYTGRIQPQVYVRYGESPIVACYGQIATEGPHNKPDLQDLQSNLVDLHLVKNVSSKVSILSLTMNGVDDGYGGQLSRGFYPLFPTPARRGA